MPKSRENPHLTERIRRRDPAAPEAVARDNFDILLRGARAAGLTGDAAYDTVQETLLVLVEKADQFDGRATLRTWLYGILLNKISERRRSDRREERFEDIDHVLDERFDSAGRWVRPPLAPDAYTAGGQAMEWLTGCMERLSDRSRTAFTMRDVESMEVADICKILSLSANNFGVVLFRARNTLRECLEQKGIRGSEDVAL